jgi:Flp pilus assembly protein TadB
MKTYKAEDFMKEEDKSFMESKSTKTAFLLMFPALIIGIIAAYYGPLLISVIAIALAIYQFIMLRQFIGDYYRK